MSLVLPNVTTIALAQAGTGFVLGQASNQQPTLETKGGFMLENTEELAIVDFGDAMEETRQCAPVPVFADSTFGLGSDPWPAPPWCPGG